MLKIFRSGVYYYRGDDDTAIEMMQRCSRSNPRMDGIRPLYASILRAPASDEARASSRTTFSRSRTADHDMAYWVASTYASLGETDLAFKWLGRRSSSAMRTSRTSERIRVLIPFATIRVLTS